MKVVITGSLGNISKPLTQMLVQKGYSITVISSKVERKKEIEKLGAKAAIGQLEDLDFLTATFESADIVYCMIPPNNYFDLDLDLLAYYKEIANNYAQAIQKSGVKQVIYLSTIGGHLPAKNGILTGHYEGEQLMNSLPKAVNISILRPVEFYYNLLGQIPFAKNESIMASVCGGDVVNVWVSPLDIAEVIVEEMETGISGRKVPDNNGLRWSLKTISRRGN